MTSYDPAAVEAMIAAALAVLDSPSDDEGGLLSVHWRRVRALCEAVAGMRATEAPGEPLRNAAQVHCNCGGFFTFDGCSFVHADHCERPRR